MKYVNGKKKEMKATCIQINSFENDSKFHMRASVDKHFDTNILTHHAEAQICHMKFRRSLKEQLVKTNF